MEVKNLYILILNCLLKLLYSDLGTKNIFLSGLNFYCVDELN